MLGNFTSRLRFDENVYVNRQDFSGTYETDGTYSRIRFVYLSIVVWPSLTNSFSMVGFGLFLTSVAVK